MKGESHDENYKVVNNRENAYKLKCLLFCVSEDTGLSRYGMNMS
jgi:hypothetical protein